MEKLEDALKFKEWAQRMADNGQRLASVEPLHLTHRANGEILFALIKIHAADPDGRKLPPVAMLRGRFVAVLVCLTDADSGIRHLLLVRQRRVATGGWFYEHPAGMVDAEADPHLMALKELQEETTLTATLDEVICLHPDAFYLSPGLLDEAGHFYYLERTVPNAEIKRLCGLQTGAKHEGEHIWLTVVRFEEAFKLLRNANSLLHLFIYAHLKGLPTGPLL